MASDTPAPADVEQRLRSSFERQRLMATLGARLTRIEAGEVCIEMPFDPAHSQQHGHVHAGAITSIVDSACGYAALSLMPADREVVSVEFKVNFVSPARGSHFVAVGKVVKAGRTITVCTGEVWALEGERSKTVAVMQATMIAVSPAD